MLFAVEEAVYLMSALKKRDFLDLVVKRMCTVSVAYRDDFIKQYMSDVANSTYLQINFCIDVMKFDHAHILVELLISHLGKGNNDCLDENSRFLLAGINMQNCFMTRPDLGEKLFGILEKLENTSNEDFKLFVHVYKQKCREIKCQDISMPSYPFKKKSSSANELDIVLSDLNKINSFDSMYSLVEFLWCNIFEKDPEEECFVQQSLRKLIEIKDKNNWNRIGRNYVSKIRRPCANTDKFVKILRSCNEIASKSNNVVTSTICEYSRPEFVQEVFCKDNEFEFQFPGTKYADQIFVLSISCMRGDDPDTFNLKMKLPDPCVKIHVTMEWFDKQFGKWIILPIKWSGKPVCDKTKSFWNWGYLHFHSEKTFESDLLDSTNGYTQWNTYLTVLDEAKCRLTAFVVE